MLILIFFCRLTKSLQTFEPIRELVAHFNTNRVIGIYMIYNIYISFRKNKEPFWIHFSSLHFTHSLTHSLSQREAMAFGGNGFGTERARLGGDALGTERARLAQGGFRGQFYKRNPFKRVF